MLKRLAILALTLAVFPVQAHAQADKTQQTGNSQKPNLPSSGTSTYTQQSNSPHLEAIGQQHVQADVRVVTAPGKDRYDKAAFWASIALVFVGFAGISVGIVTLLMLKKQTKATEDAAKAALLNAQAVINAERGRLLFEVEKTLDEQFPRVGIFKIIAVNYGRVPAGILGYSPPSETVLKYPKELPVPPQYEPEILPINRFLAPNEKFPVGKVSPAAPGFEGTAVLKLAESGVPDNVQARMVYGEIRYMDGISDEARHSRYCFRLERFPSSNIGGSLVPNGPREYNECN